MGQRMESCTLSGRSILIAEDEPLIALDIAEAFKDAGAAMVIASTLHHALMLVEHDDLSAAVLDHSLCCTMATARHFARGSMSGSCRS
jgi:CheY-like chemotaxis protein